MTRIATRETGVEPARMAAGRSDVRRHNVAALLRVLLEHGPTPRVDLARMLSLGSGTTTRITGELTKAGLLRELPGLVGGAGGRPRVPLDLSTDRFHVVGIHVGLRWTTIGLVDLRGSLVDQTMRVEHDGRLDPSLVVREASQAIEQMTAKSPARIIGTGFATGGRVDSRHGVVRAHTLLGWTDVDVAALADGQFPGTLRVDSTERALARAEMWFGAALKVPNFLHVYVGNVIGAGIVVDRRVYHGRDEGAGDIAHLPLSRPALVPCECGRSGCATSVASDLAIVRRAEREGVLPPGHLLDDLIAKAKAGDRLADYLLRDRARAVGESIAIVHDMMAPDQVILFGTPLRVPEHLAEVRAEARRWARSGFDADRMITPSALDDNAPVIAAATSVLDRFYADPFAFV
ncbi:ROK family transcriptional regulator [Actinopolymorpha sp. B9G3]|uniref:ROK family transcriptional regulator n=1 Tax=Actinopolymorpha sp. B9G3 TaxID=3158970 RepID=UPI0032D8DFA2